MAAEFGYDGEGYTAENAALDAGVLLGFPSTGLPISDGDRLVEYDGGHEVVIGGVDAGYETGESDLLVED